MGDKKRRLSFDESPSRSFMPATTEGDEYKELAERCSGEPLENLHHLSLMSPPRSSCHSSTVTRLPRNFDVNQAPSRSLMAAASERDEYKEEMAERCSEEPREDLHRLSVMPPPRSSCHSSIVTPLPRNFDLNQAPSISFTAAASEGDEYNEEMVERCSEEPREDLHRLSLMPPPRSSCHSSTVTPLPRNFNVNRAPGDEMEQATTSTRISDGCHERVELPTKKKLRLAMEQSALLEQYFNQHKSIDSKEKLRLAEELTLSPRQVEVWFQNRRARKTLKEAENKRDKLKLYCERLEAENHRLLMQIIELQASSMPTVTLRHSYDQCTGDAGASTSNATAHSSVDATAAGNNSQPRPSANPLHSLINPSQENRQRQLPDRDDS